MSTKGQRRGNPGLLLCRCGLNAILIDWFAAVPGDAKLQEHIAALLQVTGSYSVTGVPGLLGGAVRPLQERTP